MSRMEPQTGRGAADLAPPRPSPWARLGVALGAILCLWVGGFLYFVGTLPKTVENPDGETDAIIVLTGGTERLDTGVDLLRDGKAKMLLISGVDRATTRDELQVRSRLDPDKFACCVKLGREASDTVGNAIEAELWMRRGGYTSLRLVTASYHMPRSLLLFRSTLKGVSVIAHPVFPENVKADEWWLYPGTARLLAAEFAKYLVSLLTVRLAAAEDAPAPSQ